MEKLKNQIDKIKNGKLAWNKGFYGDGEWKKHVEQMNHKVYPYFDVHQDIWGEYPLNPLFEKDPMFDSWRGSGHESIIDNAEDIYRVFESLVSKRKSFDIKEYLPHFIAIKNPASMIYLLSCPRWECENDIERAFRTQVAQWIYCQPEKEHLHGLWATTHFHSKFWNGLKDGKEKIEDPWGFIAYGVEFINPKSESDDKCDVKAYEGNCRRIKRLHLDSSKFCRIVRADYCTMREKDNGYLKLEQTIGRQIDDLAKSIALSPNPEANLYVSNLANVNSNILPQQNYRGNSRRGLLSGLRNLLEGGE